MATAVAVVALCALVPRAEAGAPHTSATVEPQAAPARASALVRMSVDPRRVRLKRRTARSFVGFSVEYSSLVGLTGIAPSGPNQVFEGLLEELRAAGSGPPLLRIGGGSADEVWWNPLRRKPRPTGIQRDFTEEDAAALSSFRQRTRSPLIATVNLASPSAAIAVDLVRALVRRVGRGAFRAFEVGNEPDIYGTRDYYVDPDGRRRQARPRNYSFGNYLFDFRARARSLRAAVPGLPLAGPGSCCEPAFSQRLPGFLRLMRGQVKLVTYHEYFGAACAGVGPRNPGFPTRRKLLGPEVIGRTVNKYAPLVAAARRYRRPLRLTETNSFACGGKPGLSDTYASSLWALDYMMRMGAIGVSGMDFHTFGAYSPFTLGYTPQAGFQGSASPLYYGMLAFARATANRATILLDPTFAARVRRNANVIPWATVDRRGTVRVLIINKDARRSGPAVIRVRRGASRARLSRLTAPGLGATTGVSLAGQSVPAGSRDGRLAGARRTPTVRRRGSAYRFTMPRASAALLEVRVR